MRPLKDMDIIRAFNACQNDYTIEDMGNGQYAFMDNYSGTPFKIGDMGSILGYARHAKPCTFDKRMGDMIKHFRKENKKNAVKEEDDFWDHMENDPMITGF